ncbi:HD-GYP domain-containing protein [Bacillus sp. B190/17]|uniref:HD-GYP domain-containing protein n=1 Tax=Bacillus lumedeiriae TaxID=3058829 RepID=A0ABW8ICX6_9BACI
MYVRVEDVKEGNVLLNDVMHKASEPLMAKETVLTNWHIKILKAFLIDEVDVGEGASIGIVTESGTHTDKEKPKADVPVDKKVDFFKSYLQSVEEYKKEFQKWQAGASIDIVKIREITLPLLDEMLIDPEVIREISKYTEKESYCYHHSVATGLLSGAIAAQLNYEKGFIVQAALAGVLADCGMAKISPHILLKETSLTEREKKEVNEHPFLSYKMVKDINLLKPETKLAVFQHHERTDGSGYVNGVKAEKLLPISRIVAIADVFHAMTAERVYRKRQAPFKVLEMFRQDFFGEFDLSVVKALTELFTKLSLGTSVQLSDGGVATILFMKQQNPTRPLVQLEESKDIIDLEKRRDLHIEQVL